MKDKGISEIFAVVCRMRASIEEGSTHVKEPSRVGQGGQTQIERGNKNAYPGGRGE